MNRLRRAVHCEQPQILQEAADRTASRIRWAGDEVSLLALKVNYTPPGLRLPVAVQIQLTTADLCIRLPHAFVGSNCIGRACCGMP
jgi:hypothetical protein